VPQKMIIDTDTASDDAVALAMALRSTEVEVLAITIVAGNVPMKQGSRNARYTVELCGRAVPVYEGAPRPLVREPYPATFFHGQDGLGDQGYPAPKTPATPGDAVTALVDAVRRNPGVTLVTLGPLTNLALALREAPDLVDRVGRCVVMGGAACTVGNVNCGRRCQIQQLAFILDTDVAPQGEGIEEIHRWPPRSLAGGKIRTGQSGVIHH